MKNNLRKAFTLIEVLVAVMILSMSIIYVLQIHSQNREQIIYIADKGKQSFQDSIFMIDNTNKFHKKEKDAYEILRTHFNVNKSESVQILKGIKRNFFNPEPITLGEGQGDESLPSATLQETILKNTFSSSFYHLKQH